MQTLYLANPFGFSELGQAILSELIDILKKKYQVHNPFSSGTNINKELSTLATIPINKITNEKIARLEFLNYQIGKENMETIQSTDMVFAILDGVDVDSGVAAEIGYAYAIGKPIWGYRGDFRWAGDNIATRINLQVAYFIRASGGKIFSTLDEIHTWIRH